MITNSSQFQTSKLLWFDTLLLLCGSSIFNGIIISMGCTQCAIWLWWSMNKIWNGWYICWLHSRFIGCLGNYLILKCWVNVWWLLIAVHICNVMYISNFIVVCKCCFVYFRVFDYDMILSNTIPGIIHSNLYLEHWICVLLQFSWVNYLFEWPMVLTTITKLFYAVIGPPLIGIRLILLMGIEITQHRKINLLNTEKYMELQHE